MGCPMAVHAHSGARGLPSGSRLNHEWLPVVDTFRTLVVCPPAAVKLVLMQIQQLVWA